MTSTPSNAGESLGIVLFAHGSRDPLWRQPIEAIAAAVSEQSPCTPVACAYLELCTPNLADACKSLIDRGVSQLRVLPVFFGMGKHAREDLPLLLEELRNAHPSVTFSLLPAAGEHPLLTHLLARLALGTEGDMP
jgi:sirohydrochlorin cobaltochelatase